MSFRLRIFLLVMVVAVTAIGATAWLTLNLTSRAFNEAQASADRHRYEIADEVARYGLLHGRWPGVDKLAAGLSRQTGLHIRLITLDQTVLVDTDNLAGRAAGPVRPGPMLIDPRPQLEGWAGDSSPPALSALLAKGVPGRRLLTTPLFEPARGGDLERTPVAGMLRQLAQYRAALVAVRCIADKKPGSDAVLATDRAPYLTGQQLKEHPDCVSRASKLVLDDRRRIDIDMLTYRQCSAPTSPDEDRTCAATTFNDRAGVSAALPLQLYLGAPADTDVGRLGRPAAFGAAGLIVVALIGTAWIARVVSHPVRRLTEASRLLAGGRLDVRVPTSGRGELARLSQTFNAMAEAVQSSEERQRRLVADVAHEMRTPLSNLRGYLEGLSDGVVEPSRELFVSLHEETMLQRRILDDLQVLALAEVGDLRYAKGPIDLADLVQVGATVHRAVAAEAGIALTVDVPAPVWIEADPDRLRQVLGNLLTNAVRYTDTGGHVLVRVRQRDAQAVLTVRDTGVGMTPEDLLRVFDRFWRADPARQRATGGTGLGLTIAQRIVRDHDGYIEVTSEPGAGTTFTVCLPLRPTAGAGADPPSLSAGPPP
ncbi:ATP-binding protein [Actinoplanes sp. NPDC048967]|uniref:sensor histidine kinase n=1 Tax=Actinoplanes sp. NPDC048967 TaxID=3155269 RepID=UPI0033EEDCDD